MTFGERLRNVLVRDQEVSSVVNERVFPMLLPTECTLPAIVYTIVTDTPTNSLQGSTGKLRNARVQIDCYAPKYLPAQTLADAVAGALGTIVRADFTSMQLSRMDRYEADTKLFGVSMDFSMWMTEE